MGLHRRRQLLRVEEHQSSLRHPLLVSLVTRRHHTTLQRINQIVAGKERTQNIKTGDMALNPRKIRWTLTQRHHRLPCANGRTIGIANVIVEGMRVKTIAEMSEGMIVTMLPETSDEADITRTTVMLGDQETTVDCIATAYTIGPGAEAFDELKEKVWLTRREDHGN